MRIKLILFGMAMLSILSSYAQRRTLSGKVQDAESQQPISGVTITYRGSAGQNAVATNEAGDFTIEVDGPSGVLQITAIGYETKQANYSSAATLSIQLDPENSALDEVVVIGYGTVRKRDLTGSVVSIKGDEIAKVPSANIMESIQGKIPGMDVTRSSGSAASGVNIAVRGTRSITAQNGPLYIVDGVQYSNIQDINPNDIESTEVLKDASSTAIYGSRGANGVIIITTKRGKSGKASVSANMYGGISQVARYPQVMNKDQWVALRREAHRTTGRWNSIADDGLIFNNAEIAAIANDEYVNYYDLLVRDGSQQNYQVGINAGSENTVVYFSGDYFREQGVFDRDLTNRFSGRLNIDQKLGNYFKTGMQAQVTRYEIGRHRDPLNQANKMNPLGRAFDDNGEIIMYPLNGSAINPLADMQPDAYLSRGMITRSITNAYVELTGWKGFSGKSTIGVTLNNDKDGVFAGSYTIDRNGGLSRATYAASSSYLINMENVLNYQREFGGHNITLTGVNSLLWNNSESINALGDDLLLDRQAFYALGNAGRNTAVNTAYRMDNLLSFAGRVNYSYQGKYLATVTGRTDGSSILAQGRKWAFFPSAAVGWRIVDENFMASQNIFTELKLRGSYGKAGNYAVDPYSTQNSLTRVGFGWDDNSATGYTFSPQIGNPGLGWEITATTNLGLDYGFLNNRILGTIDVYDSRTSDLLLERALPESTGVQNIVQNIGKTRNRGIELGLSGDVLRVGDFTWNVGLSFTSNREEIVELVTKEDDIVNGWFIGHPIDVHFNYDKLGIWQLGQEAEAAQYGQEPGHIRVRDVNGDGVINAADRTILGNPRPDWLGGWDNNFSYKGFDLNVYIFARWGQMIQPDFLRRYDPQGLGQSTAATADYWTPENPTNAYPRPHAGTALNSMLYNGALGFVDASFIRIRNISLGYNVDRAKLQNSFVKSLRVYGTARNPFTWTKSAQLHEYDPERGGSENFPMTRLFIFGLNVGF